MNAQQKWTPGPWRSGRDDMISSTMDGEEFKAIYATDARAGGHMGRQLPLMVAKAVIDINTSNQPAIEIEEVLANAHLIAAAPTMAEALKAILSHVVGDLPTAGYLRDNDASRKALSDARAVLAKASQ